MFDQISLSHRQCKLLQFWPNNCFVLQQNDLYQILFSFYIQSFMLGKKAVYNGLSLELDHLVD